MKGLHAICQECVVQKHDSYVNNKGQTIFQCFVAGFGFANTFMSKDSAVAASWPKPGTEVDVVAPLERDFEGKLRMGDADFVVRKPARAAS